MNDEYSSDKEAHSKILSQENQKVKKKRVSFSICNANTLEEMETLRKQKEKDLINILKLKTAANKNFEEESMTFGDKLSRTNPNEIVKAENIFLQNQSISNKPILNLCEPTHEILFSYENISHNENKENLHMNRNFINTINSDTLSVRSPKENILFSEERDHVNKSELIFSQDNPTMLSNRSLEIKFVENKEMLEEKNEIENKFIEESPEIREEVIQLVTDIINPNILNENENSIKNCSINDFSEILFSILCRSQQETKTQFSTELIKNLKYQNNLELFLLGKINHFNKRKTFENYLNKIKNGIKLSKYSVYNKNQACKYIKYRQYKKKLQILNELKYYSLKRKEWIQKVHRDIKRVSLW